MHFSRTLLQGVAILFLAVLPALGQTRPVDVDAMLSARFVYNPSVAAVLSAPGEDIDPSQSLPYWVAVGNWKKVGAILARIPLADATRVHTRIVEGLLATANNPLSASAPPTEVAKRPAPPGRPAAAPLPPVMIGDVLQPQDVLELADALPATAPLQNGTAALLGQLLAKTIGATGLPDSVVQQLLQGTVHFGENDPANLSATVVFLLAAGQPDLAITLLPDERTIFTLVSPPKAMLYQQCLLVSAEKAEASGDSPTANLQRHVALRLTVALLHQPMPEAVALPLVKQAIGLSEKTGDVVALDAWLGELIAAHAPQLPTILEFIARPIPPAGGQANYDQRLSRLSHQRHLVELIATSRVTGEHADDALQAVLRLFAMNWATEADLTRLELFEQPKLLTPSDARALQHSLVNPDVLKEISAELLLLLQPSDDWANEIKPQDRPRFDNDRLDLLMASNRRDEGMALLQQMAKADSSITAEEKVAGGALTVWVFENMPGRIAIKQNERPIATKGVPTARVTQAADFQAMIDMLDLIGQAYGRPFPRRLLPTLFDCVHSQAEVYTLAEIERVFGPVEQMDTSTVTQLYAIMSQNLRKVWPADQVQVANGTNRSDDQKMQQVMEGYRTLTTLLQRRLTAAPDWQLETALAGARFQEAELGLKTGSGLAAYTQTRDSAFAAMHQAAAEYAKTVSSEDNGMETIDLYNTWFSIALGASDLAALRVTDIPAQNEIDQLRDAIHALPGDAAQRHIERFANLIDDQAPSLAPDVKERIIRNGLIVVGNTPLADPLRTLMKSYTDLLTELKLTVALDGTEQVGNKEPFGLIISMEHTDSLEAESLGFAKYILTPDQGSHLKDGRRPDVNYRDNFQKRLHEALDKSFEIENILWAPEDVKPQPINRIGWSKTPLAYVVVKAKDASIDRVPPVQLDIDFNDRMNMVILPVTSSMLVIDAASSSPRPIAELSIDQRVNDNDLSKGLLKLEVRASARGLVPPLENLWALSSLSRFSVTHVNDGGLKVDRFDTNPTNSALPLTALSQREWTVSLTAKDPIQGNINFNFPPLASEYAHRSDVTATYHRYDDADVVDAGPSVIVHGISAPTHRPIWALFVIPVLVIAAVTAVVWKLFRARSVKATDPKAETMNSPAPGLFAQMRMLSNLKANPIRNGSEVDQLNQDIRALELDYFSASSRRSSGQPNNKDLDLIVGRWK